MRSRWAASMCAMSSRRRLRSFSSACVLALDLGWLGFARLALGVAPGDLDFQPMMVISASASPKGIARLPCSRSKVGTVRLFEVVARHAHARGGLVQRALMPLR